MNIIPAQYRLVAIAIAVVICTGVVSVSSWRAGAKMERAEWQVEKLKMQQEAQKALQERIAQNESILKDQQAKARKASESHEKARSELQAKYDAAIAASRANGGLRVPASICRQPTIATETASAGRFDEASPGTVALPEEVERRRRTRRTIASAAIMDKG